MFNTKTLLLGAAALAFISIPLTSQAEDMSCDDHAMHIDQEIGAEHALEAYHVLHGDQADDNNVIDTLKEAHPDIEQELEKYVSAGCDAAALEAHANDDAHEGEHEGSDHH